MSLDRYAYPAEKFAAARRILMVPHPKGEAYSIAVAFHECELGLGDMQPDDFDDDAKRWVSTVTSLMDTTGIDDQHGRGTAFIKAESLSVDEQSQFAHAIDSLADWFHARFMGRE